MRIILNCAMSVDGKIALPSRKETEISNREDKERVHALRNSVDAILVGIGTILADDPKLTVGEKYTQPTRKPLRIIVDSKGRIPITARALNRDARTLIVTNEYNKNAFPGADVVRFGKDEVNLRALIGYLDKQGIKTLLVEGGERILWSFLRDGLADELTVFVGSMIIGGKGSPTLAGGEGFSDFAKARRLSLIDCQKLGDGVLLRYEVIK